MYSNHEQKLLLELAKKAIAWSCEHPQPLPVTPEDYPPALRQVRACFVTLHKNGQLRGCIGSLQAFRPLVEDISHNAFAAAQKDPRFTPLKKQELPLLQVDISVLTPATPVEFDSEADLLNKIRPGVDGLILSDKGRRGTFLPSVWQQLPEPKQFLQHLKQKAGFPPGYWSDTIEIARYQTEIIQDK